MGQRLFVAVWPPVEIVDVLWSLERADQPGVRWVDYKNLHVTLKFLGSVETSEQAIASIGQVESVPLVATLGPVVGVLNPQIVSVAVAGLESLAADVDDAFTGIGQQPEHPFQGHLTLARLRVRQAVPLVGTPVAATWTVDEVALVRSHTRHTGAVYETIAVRRLGPGRS